MGGKKRKKFSDNDVFWIKKDFSRRRFLRGAINGMGIAIGTPIFECLLNNSGTAFAQGAPLPLRFGTFAWGLGYGLNINHWNPSGAGAGSAWSIPANHGLTDLIPHKSYLTVFSNYSHKTPSGAGHIPQRGVAFSCSHNPNWVLDNANGAHGFRNQSMPLPTIDAVIGAEFLKSHQTLFNYLNVTAKFGTLYVGTSSWNTGGGFRNFLRSPVELYDKVFKPFSSGLAPTVSNLNPATLDLVTLRMKKSVLDGLVDDIKSYQSTLSAADKLRLDAHLASVEEVERTIATLIKQQETPPPVDTGGGGSGGGDPVDPGGGSGGGSGGSGGSQLCQGVSSPNNYSGIDQVELRCKITAKLMAYALSCDLTRTFCYELTPTQTNGNLPEIGLSSSAGLHDGPSHTQEAPMRDYLRFVMKNYGHFVNEFKSVAEGTGNLLDNSLIMGTSELGQSKNHSSDGNPYIFAGKAGGNLKGDYHARYSGSLSNNEAKNILYTATRACGLNLASIGMPATAIIGKSGTTGDYRATTAIGEVLK